MLEKPTLERLSTIAYATLWMAESVAFTLITAYWTHEAYSKLALNYNDQHLGYLTTHFLEFLTLCLILGVTIVFALITAATALKILATPPKKQRGKR